MVDDGGGGAGVKGKGLASSIRGIGGGSGVRVAVDVSSKDINLSKWISNGEEKNRIEKKDFMDTHHKQKYKYPSEYHVCKKLLNHTLKKSKRLKHAELTGRYRKITSGRHI